MNEENDNIMDDETDDMDAMFAELDGISSSGDDGGDRDAVTIAKDIGNVAKDDLADTDKLMESVNDAVKNALPSPVKKEVEKIKEIHREILEPMGKAFDGARKSASGFINTISSVLPEIPGVNSTLTRIANAIAPDGEDDDDSYGGYSEESEDETIKNNVSDVFQENNAEKRTREKLEAVNNLSELELAIRNLKNMEVLKDYFTTDHYSYIKKSLELQFKQVIALGDIRNRFGIYTEENKELLRAIIKNTGLPDMIKLKNSEVIEHKLKEKAIGKGLDLIGKSDFVKNLKGAAEEKIINTALGFADMTDMFGENLATVKDSMESLSAKDKSDMLARMGTDWIRDTIVGKVTNKLSNSKVGNKVLGKAGKAIQKITNDPGEFFRNIVPERFQDNKIVEGFTDILNEASSQEGVRSISLKNNEDLESPAVFDVSAHKAIVNIIPNLLSKMLNELQGIRTGKFNKNDELRFDFKDNKFKSQETIKQETVTELNDVSKSFQDRTQRTSENIINSLLGNKHTPDDVALFKKGLEKIILNGDSGNIIQWYNDTSVFDNFDSAIKRKVFDGVKKLVLDDNLESMVKINNITSELDYVRRSANFMSDSMQTLIDRGDLDLIGDLGIVDKGSSEISTDNVKKLLTKGVTPGNEPEVANETKNTQPAISQPTRTEALSTNQPHSFSPIVAASVDLTPLQEILFGIKSTITDKLSQIGNINSRILDTLLNRHSISNFESTNAVTDHSTSSATSQMTNANIHFSTTPGTNNFSLIRPTNNTILPEPIKTRRSPVVTAENFSRDIKTSIINISNATINIKEAVVNQTLSAVKEIGSTVTDSVTNLADSISTRLSNTINTVAETDLNKIFSQETLNSIKETSNKHIDNIKNTEIYKSGADIANRATDNIKNTESYKQIETKLNNAKNTETFKKISKEINKIKDPEQRKKLKQQLTATKHKAETGLDYIKEHGAIDSIKKTSELINQTDSIKNIKTVKENLTNEINENGLLNTIKNTTETNLKNVTNKIKNSEVYHTADNKLNDIKKSEVYKDTASKINTVTNNIKNSEAYKTTSNKINTVTDNIRNTIGDKIDSKVIENSIKSKYKDNAIEVQEPNEKGEMTKSLLVEIGDEIITIPTSSLNSVTKLTNFVRSQVGITKTPTIVKELLGDTENIITSTTKKIDEISNSAISKKINTTINNVKDSEIVKTAENKISNISNKINNVTTSAINKKDIEQHIKSKYKDSIIEVDEKDKNGKINKNLLIDIGDTLLTIPVTALVSPLALAKVIKNQVGFLKTPGIMKELLPSATSIMSNIKNSVNEQLKKSPKEEETNITSDVKNENKVNTKEDIVNKNNTPIDNNLSIIEKQKILANKFNNPVEATDDVEPETFSSNINKSIGNIFSTMKSGSEVTENIDQDSTEDTDEHSQESTESTSNVNNTTTSIKSLFSGLFSRKINLRKQLKKKYGKKIDFIKIKGKKDKAEKVFMITHKNQIIGIPEHSLKDTPTLLEDLQKQVKPWEASSLVKDLLNNNKEKLDYKNASIENFIEYFSGKEYEQPTASNDSKFDQEIADRLKEKANQRAKEAENAEAENTETNNDIEDNVKNTAEDNESTTNDNFITKAIKNNKTTNSMFNKAKSILGINKKPTDINEVISKLKDIDVKDTTDIYNKIPDSIKPFITKDENGSFIVTLNDDIYKVDEEGLAKLLPTIQEKIAKGEVKLNNGSSSGNTFNGIQSKLKEGGVGGAVSEVASDIKNTIIEKVKENKGVSQNALGKTLSVMFNGKNPLKDKLNAVDIAKAFTSGSFKGAFWFGRNVLRPGYKKMFSTVGAVAHEAGKSILTKGFGFSPEIAEGVLGLVEAPFKLVSKAMGGVNTIFKKAKEAFQGFFSIIGKIGKFFLGGAWKLVKKGMGFLTGKSEEEIGAKINAGKDKVKNIGKNAHSKWMKAENSGILAKLGMGTIRKTVGTAAKLPLMPFKATKSLADTFIITDKEEENLWLNKKMRDAKSLKNKVTTGTKNKFSTVGHLFNKIKDTGFDAVSSILPTSVNGVDKKVDEDGRTVVSIGDAEEFKKSSNPIKDVASKIKNAVSGEENTPEEMENITKPKKHNESIFSKLANKLKPKKNGIVKREEQVEELRNDVKPKKHNKTKQDNNIKKSKHKKSIFGRITNGIKNTFSAASKEGELGNNLIQDINVPSPVKSKSIFSSIINKLKPKENNITKRENHIEELRNSLEHKNDIKNFGEKKESSSFGFTAILGLLGTAVTFIKKLFGGITSIGKHLFNWLPKIGDGIKSLGGHIANVVTKVAHSAIDIVKGGYNKIKTSLGFGDKTPKSTHIPEKGDIVKSTENKSWFSKIADKAKSMASSVYDKASSVVSTVKDKVVDVASKVKGGISKILHSAADIVKHPWSSVKEAVSHLVDTPFVKNIATKIKTFLPKMKTIILDKLGPAAGEKALGKIGSMAIPGAGEAMMLWTAGEVAWDMLKHKMSLPSALSDSLIGIDLFKKEAPKAEDVVENNVIKHKGTGVETKTTDKTKDIELGAKTAKETNNKINNIPTDIKTNTPIIPKDTKLNSPDKLQPVNPITHQDNPTANLKIQNINKPQPTIIKNKIDDKHTKILAAHGSKIAATTEKQLSVQEEISENLKTLTDIMTSMFDKKGKHIRKVKTPTSNIHKTPVPAPKAAVSSYSTDF